MLQPKPIDIAYLEYEEGVVLKAYLDPTNTWTIGTGFTNGSAVATRYLGKIKRGMTITRDQNRIILTEAITQEYGPPVIMKMPGAEHHEQIAGLSIAFNAGPRALDWNWAKEWRAGNKKRAAELMEVTATTSKGKKLAGLVNRRKREATLLLTGRYPTHLKETGAVASTPAPVRSIEVDEVLKEYQGKLKKLGIDPGLIDGRRGPKTTAAVLRFQKAHPDLDDDGILGKATMAQIDRALDLVSKSAKQAGGGAAIVTSAGGLAVSWPVGLALGAAFFVVVAVVLAVKYRGEIEALIKK